MESCVKVYVSCSGPRRRLPYWKRVYRGMQFGDCHITFAYPSECVMAPGTRVEYVPPCNYREEELQHNVVIRERCNGGDEKLYVFPKKPYYELKRLYVEPMAMGEQPFNTGVILCGPPGTGKTTMARIVARLLGVSVVEIAPDKVLSKWVGDSEKAIRRMLNEAKRGEPSVVVINDAEWLISARRLASSDESGKVMLNIQNILFDEMQAVYDSGRRVLFIATTNVKPSEIDVALLRHGRFGDPIFIPLPDYEAMHAFLRQFFGDGEAARYAKRFVNMGLSFADVLGMVKRLKRGLEPKRKVGSGRGYARVYVEPVEGFEKIFDLFPREALERRSRVYCHGNKDVWTAIIAQLGYVVKRPVIKMVDIRYYDEAVFTANTLGGILVSSTDFPLEVQQYIDENADVPVFFVGRQPPRVDAFPFFSLAELRSLRREIIEAVLRYKGIGYDERFLRKVMEEASGTSRLETFLEMVSVLGHVDERLLSRLAYIKR